MSDFDRYIITRKGFVRQSIKQDCDHASMSLFERSYTVLLSGVKYFVQVVLQNSQVVIFTFKFYSNRWKVRQETQV